MSPKIALDSSFLMGLLDDKDLGHAQASQLQEAFKSLDVQPYAFDCVLAEVISALARRVHEKRRTADLPTLIVSPGPISNPLDYLAVS